MSAPGRSPFRVRVAQHEEARRNARPHWPERSSSPGRKHEAASGSGSGEQEDCPRPSVAVVASRQHSMPESRWPVVGASCGPQHLADVK